MEWKDFLSTISARRIITPYEFRVLIELAKIRDNVFFPGYQLYGYVGYEPKFERIVAGNDIFSLDISLDSKKNNRKLNLRFRFQPKAGAINGGISDSILILHPNPGWGNYIDMEILIRKKTNQAVKEYGMLINYPGTFGEKITACLKQIKYNYEKYAADIIKGENWDDKAWDNSYF